MINDIHKFFCNWAEYQDALFRIEGQLEVINSLFSEKVYKKYEQEYRRNEKFWYMIRWSLTKSVFIDSANLCQDKTKDAVTGRKAFSVLCWEKYFAEESRKQKNDNNMLMLKKCENILALITELRETNLSEARGLMAHNSSDPIRTGVGFDDLRKVCDRHKLLLKNIIKYMDDMYTGSGGRKFSSGRKKELKSIEKSSEEIMAKLLDKKKR